MSHEHQFETARNEMLEQHLRQRGIRSSAVLATMERVPREAFVPAALRDEAYSDRALQIDCQQTISQPYIVALMTEALQLTGNERVLEIGTGSGYQTAVLAELAAEVYSIERHEPLSHQAAVRLRQLGYTNVHLKVGDGSHGWLDAAPFDRCLIAAAAQEIPPAVWQQLREGGVLVAPLGTFEEQTLYVFHKVVGEPKGQALTLCRFVPLVKDRET
jgi:protein-L-isoaspartate(D-aspartate) O-methyltransferase